MNKRYLWVASALLVLAGCAKSVDPVVEPKPAAKANDPWTLQDLSSQMKKGPAGEHSLQADFAGTRSSVAMNEAGTSAASVWSAGAKGCMPPNLLQLRGSISAAAFSFMVQLPSGIIEWASEMSLRSSILM